MISERAFFSVSALLISRNRQTAFGQKPLRGSAPITAVLHCRLRSRNRLTRTLRALPPYGTKRSALSVGGVAMPKADVQTVANLLREYSRRSALRGDNPYRARAYARAADSVAAL